jgi:hypothetical protein
MNQIQKIKRELICKNWNKNGVKVKAHPATIQSERKADGNQTFYR